MPQCGRVRVTRHATIVVSAFSVFFVGTVAATILGKLGTIEASIYPFALTMLSPIAGLIVYPLVVLGLILAGFMPPETRKVPLWKAAVVGVLFCLHNVLENLGNRGNVVPGPIALILLKSIVPITFAGTYLVRSLRPKYQWTHYLAVVMLLAGIATTLGSSLGHLRGFSFNQSAGYMVLLLTSVLPLAAAFLFIEVQLKRRHPKLHPTYLWAVVCVFEALVSIPLAFFNAALQNIEMDHVFSNISEGMQCFVLGSPAGPRLMPGDGGETVVTVDCAKAHAFYLTGLVPGFALNFAMPLCAKYGSATTMWFVRALALPVASILFAVPGIMGRFAAKLTGWEWGGLALVFAANVVYNLKSSAPDSKRAPEGPAARKTTEVEFDGSRASSTEEGSRQAHGVSIDLPRDRSGEREWPSSAPLAMPEPSARPTSAEADRAGSGSGGSNKGLLRRVLDRTGSGSGGGGVGGSPRSVDLEGGTVGLLGADAVATRARDYGAS